MTTSCTDATGRRPLRPLAVVGTVRSPRALDSRSAGGSPRAAAGLLLSRPMRLLGRPASPPFLHHDLGAVTLSDAAGIMSVVLPAEAALVVWSASDRAFTVAAEGKRARVPEGACLLVGPHRRRLPQVAASGRHAHAGHRLGAMSRVGHRLTAR